MITELMYEYYKELEKFKKLKDYEERKEQWQQTHPTLKPWDFPEERPNPNKAKLKRLGIMIRQKMIEIEKGLDGYE